MAHSPALVRGVVVWGDWVWELAWGEGVRGGGEGRVGGGGKVLSLWCGDRSKVVALAMVDVLFYQF